MTLKQRIETIRKAHESELAKRGQVPHVDLGQVDETEKENVPCDEKLESILKCTNGNSQGNFLENVDGDAN